MNSNFNKHAYLIMAHDKFEQLNFLLKLLDDERNDVYLLIDKKVKGFNKETIVPMEKSSIMFYREYNNWGGESLVISTMKMLKAASEKQYSYYHLISGSDMPLHSQNYIHSFFELNNGKNFVSFCGDDIIEKSKPYDRIKYYYPFMDAKHLRKFFLSFQRRVFIPFQKAININRNKNVSVGYGSEWFSITHDLAKKMVDDIETIIKRYKWTCCSDELFVQTFILENKMEDTLYTQDKIHDKPEDRQANARYINWWEGSPKLFNDSDINEILEASHRGYLFARKFDIDNSPKMRELINKLATIDEYNDKVIDIL